MSLRYRLISYAVALCCLFAVQIEMRAQRRSGPQVSMPTPVPVSGKDKKSKRSNESRQEVVIDSIGLKLADVRYIMPEPASLYSDGGKLVETLLPVITAVQENGPAFYAGLVPGDVIGMVDYERSPNSQKVANYISGEQGRDPIGSVGLHVFSSVNGALRFENTFFDVAFDVAKDNRWITDAPAHGANGRGVLPELAQALANAQRDFDAFKAESLALIEKAPCEASGRNIRTRVEQLQKLAKFARLDSTARNHEYLIKIADTSCDNFKNGEITETELVVRLIVERRLDPCAYSPTTDYRAQLKGTYHDVSFVSKKEYERNYFSLHYMQTYLERATPAQKNCFFEFLKSSLSMQKQNNK